MQASDSRRTGDSKHVMTLLLLLARDGTRKALAVEPRPSPDAASNVDAERFADDIIDTFAEHELDFIANALRHILEILAVARR